MSEPLAIVGLACRYPDARSPEELWELVVAQRRAFRRMPAVRLRLEDYHSADPAEPDRTYVEEAAVLEGYAFDRVRHRVAGSTFRSADVAHWLALDVAGEALRDAGFEDGGGLPREATGVVVGNTMTGEFSRANVMRLRWPYVRRVVEAELARLGLAREAAAAALAGMEATYKAPFPPVGEETLAGGLSNTIAGRICNHFDLKGGGFTVDGACSSSLLAVTQACSALAAGDLDVAVVGGVDLSLDPFELVGFAKTGALAPREMRVYDQGSAGFWPGEGCGFAVLMRRADAVAGGRRIRALVRGWGVSSDGQGGITRPEVEGQRLALRRAYRRAGFGIETVGYFEGHGTGTAVGDATEIEALSRELREAGARPPFAALGSVKANIGHTKAAAGMAGLIKAALALEAEAIPPACGVDRPHQLLQDGAAVLRVPRSAERWPEGRALRSAVSAMGFGGINTHVVLESPAPAQRGSLRSLERRLSGSAQDGELLPLGAASLEELGERVESLAALAPAISRAELTDLACHLQRTCVTAPFRAAVVASTPRELAERLRLLAGWIAGGGTARLDVERGVFLGTGGRAPRLGFLFPGQGSPAHVDGGAWRRRFEPVRALYEAAALPRDAGVATEVAQPAIATASMACLRVLAELGVEASVGVGHSLGELVALHWAGALDEEGLLRLARVRGRAMADLGAPSGAMASLALGPREVGPLLDGLSAGIAGYNSPRQTVISGDAPAVDAAMARARRRGAAAVRLPVSHAFHSPLVEKVAPILGEHLARERLSAPRSTVASTVTGKVLQAGEDLRALLRRQVTAPVRFTEALAAAGEVDLWMEVGPGRVLAGLAAECGPAPVIPLDAGGPSLLGVLHAAGAAFALGAPVQWGALLDGRFARPFDPGRKLSFLESPCEQAPLPSAATPSQLKAPAPSPAAKVEVEKVEGEVETGRSPLDVVRELVAARAELPPDSIGEADRLLGDLHLNSISVSQVVVEAARRLGLPPPAAPLDYSHARVGDLARALQELASTAGTAAPAPRLPAGVDAWVRSFRVEWVERSRPPAPTANAGGEWRVFAPEGHPLAAALRERLAAVAPGPGVAVCLSPRPPAAGAAPASERQDNGGAGAGPALVATAEPPSASGKQGNRVPADEVSRLEAADAALLLEAARAALALPSSETARFLVVHHGGGGGAFARTLHLEAPRIATCIVDAPLETAAATGWIAAEAAACAAGLVECRYDAAGARREPALHLLPPTQNVNVEEPVAETRREPALRPPQPGHSALADLYQHPSSPSPGGGAAGSRHAAPADLPLGSSDVLLVTGGGKGISAECALDLARATGAAALLLGRSRPEDDAELSSNLARFTAAGVRMRYVQADVTDAASVQRAVREGESALGPVTAVLHGAGMNVPRRLETLDEATLLRTLAPKLAGARNVLAAVSPERLKLFVAFGSIIGRVGLAGEADYALANEWLTRLVERLGAEHPRCRCLSVEWSIWSGVGMGERLGRVDALVHQGISAIPPERGVAILRELLAAREAPVAAVVTGRLGERPPMDPAPAELPFLRFLEQPRVFYPGIELVADAQLSGETDLALDDHVYRGERLFPAVLGLEAMAQAAMAVTATGTPPSFERVSFDRPVVVAPGTRQAIRVAALVRSPGVVEVALRCEQTSFQVDHFRALCRVRAPGAHPPPASWSPPAESRSHAGLVPQRDLYGGLFFHGGRFRRVARYLRLQATECVAELSPSAGAAWFARYLPDQLVLGDPAVRDAAIHAIQACIPHQRLLPAGVDLIEPLNPSAEPRYVIARERRREGRTFIYDVEIAGAHGQTLERWSGLKLMAVEPVPTPSPWPPSLLPPFIERRLADLVPSDPGVAVALELEAGLDRRARSDRAFERLLKGAAVARRPDGKPVTVTATATATAQSPGPGVSAAHSGPLTLAVAGSGGVACDLQAVEVRPPSVWRELLGPDRAALAELVAQEQAEELQVTATRIWAAMECLKKAGLPAETPLLFRSAEPDGWMVFSAGLRAVATLGLGVQESSGPLVAAVLPGGSDARV